MAKRKDGFPDLDRYLEGKLRKWVTYKEGARIYGVPFYSFVRLAKEAEANYTLRHSVIVDVDIIEAYLDEHPEVWARLLSVRKV